MNKYRELFIAEITCGFCKNCDPWVLCECYTCAKKWWRRATLAGRWCESCLEKEVSIARLLTVTGHESLNSDRYFHCCNDYGSLDRESNRSGDRKHIG